MASAWIALVSGLAAPMPAAATRAEALSASRCPSVAPSVRTGRRDDPPPPAGIELLNGVTTGMSREDVRRIDPWLTTNRPSRAVELVDGIRLRANVNFWGRPERAVSIEMNGDSNVDRVVAALSRRYGRPLVTKRPATVQLKWCDGPRRITLLGRSDDFWVTVAGQD